MFNWFNRSSKSKAAARLAALQQRRARSQPAPVDPGALARLPGSASRLSAPARARMAGLPPTVSLNRTCERFPHVVERLLKYWPDPVAFRAALTALMVDTRGGRQGFPFDVVMELVALGDHYDRQVAPPKAGAWNSVDAR
jgi:hypothetical protein